MSLGAREGQFWQSPWLWLGLALASASPFLFATILPFNDLPNHVGRHHVFLTLADDPFLQRFYRVHWLLSGNLGVDLVVRAIGPWLGAEVATRVAVAAIPPLTISGIYSLSRATSGSVQPAALVATPLVINWPLVTGFANFCLAAAIALLVLALWIRLRRLSFVVRLVAFIPLAFLTWVAHTAGWGLLGLGVLAFEIQRAWHADNRVRALALAPFQTLPFAAMLLFTILWRRGTSGGAAVEIGQDFFRGKLIAFASLFREQFVIWDVSSTLIFVGLAALLYWRGGRQMIGPAFAIAFTYLLAFLVCPQEVFKSGFADRRLLTYGVIVALLAIGVAPRAWNDLRRRRAIVLATSASLALFGARMTVAGFVWHDASQVNEDRLALIDIVPLHSRILGLVLEACGQRWGRIGRPDHIQQYALVRRDSMINGMFQNPGLNQVEALYDRDTGFNPNRYAVVHDESCPVSYIPETLQNVMRDFPRDHYDFVWLIGEEPLSDFYTDGLQLLASRGNDRLYRVDGSKPGDR